MNPETQKSNDGDPEVRRLKWIFGTTYAVQGSSALSEIPSLYFIKFVLEMGEAGGQLFQSLKSLGWLVKPLWGYLSDHVPLFGYRRKSWFILMALSALVFWAVNALFAYAGVRMPLVYLVGFNLAFSTYAFVDVVGDALMVEHGRRLRRVASFVNFQWTMLALANAASATISGWFQEKIVAGEFAYWVIFALTGIPPLFTAAVGVVNISEVKQPRPGNGWRTSAERKSLSWSFRAAAPVLRYLKEDGSVMVFLALFIVMWNFSPSIGYIERSYLIDIRDFSPSTFGTIFTAQALTFLMSIFAYRWVVRRWPGIRWYHYLYAMVGLMTVTFPLSFYLYLDPGHPWWTFLTITVPAPLNPLPEWNRYEWFRLLFSIVLGFATIPAFIIPLRLAGEAVAIRYAGMGYAFLTALTNATNMIEGLVGSALYWIFTREWMGWLLDGFHGSWLDIAGVADERTLILQLFVYISLSFTLLAAPFVYLLQRVFARQGIEIVGTR